MNLSSSLCIHFLAFLFYERCHLSTEWSFGTILPNFVICLIKINQKDNRNLTWVSRFLIKILDYILLQSRWAKHGTESENEHLKKWPNCYKEAKVSHSLSEPYQTFICRNMDVKLKDKEDLNTVILFLFTPATFPATFQAHNHTLDS